MKKKTEIKKPMKKKTEIKKPYGWVAYNPKTKKYLSYDGKWTKNLTSPSVYPITCKKEDIFVNSHWNIEAKPIYLSFK